MNHTFKNCIIVFRHAKHHKPVFYMIKSVAILNPNVILNKFCLRQAVTKKGKQIKE